MTGLRNQQGPALAHSLCSLQSRGAANGKATLAGKARAGKGGNVFLREVKMHARDPIIPSSSFSSPPAEKSGEDQREKMQPSKFSFCVLSIILFLRITKSSEVYKISLGGEGNRTVHWLLNYEEKAVEFEVHAILPKNSWFAIGFSDYGDLLFGDFCVFWTDWRKKYHFEDVWTSEDGRISVDKIQNCDGFRYSVKGEEVKFAFQRKFDTCDPHDYVIEDGTTHVVWAEGDGPLYRLDGVNISAARRSGFERTQLLKNENENETHPPDTWTLEILAHEVRVPEVETTYWCHVHKLPESLGKKHHVIQYEPVIQAGNEHLVHHMEVFHCEAEAKEEIPDYAGSCFDGKRPEKTQACKRVLAAWAMGAKSFSYPQGSFWKPLGGRDGSAGSRSFSSRGPRLTSRLGLYGSNSKSREAGLPIGGPQFNRFVMLEVHYNNPEKIEGRIDSSGIKFYLTPSLRKYDGGVMELGLEYTDKMAIPPGLSSFQLSGYCITECTAVGLPDEGILVFGSQLHTHLLGTQVHTKHVRNGVELPELNRDNHYSTHFQEIRRLKRFVRVLPGDALITTCTYRSLQRSNITLGGFSITDEMCVNYIHYYPKTDLEVCKSSVAYADLLGYFDYLRQYENQDTDSRKAISENYKAIEWSPLRVEVLKDLYAGSGISMQCNRSSGERFPGDWEALPTTKIYKPFKIRRRCHD